MFDLKMRLLHDKSFQNKLCYSDYQLMSNDSDIESGKYTYQLIIPIYLLYVTENYSLKNIILKY